MSEATKPDPFGDFPSARTVADELECGRAECEAPDVCWSKGGCRRTFDAQDRDTTDWKSRPRIRDTSVIRRKLLAEKECRVPDCGDQCSDGHHLLYRSLGGDDTEDNIIPLCHVHHMVLEFDAGPDREWVRKEIGKTLTRGELSYPLLRLGVSEGIAFLKRGYGVELKDHALIAHIARTFNDPIGDRVQWTPERRDG